MKEEEGLKIDLINDKFMQLQDIVKDAETILPYAILSLAVASIGLSSVALALHFRQAKRNVISTFDKTVIEKIKGF